MTRRSRKRVAKGKPLPTKTVLEMFQHLEGPPPPPYSSRQTHRNPTNTAPRNYTFSNIKIDQPSCSNEPERISFDVTFESPSASSGGTGQPIPKGLEDFFRVQPRTTQDLVLDWLQPIMNENAFTDDVTPTATEEKFQNKKKPNKPDAPVNPPKECPFEAEARKLWEQMSENLCPCRKWNLLEKLSRDCDALEQQEVYLQAQIGSYRLFQNAIADELERREVAIVLVVDEDDQGQPKIRYRLESKGEQEVGDKVNYDEEERRLKVYL